MISPVSVNPTFPIKPAARVKRRAKTDEVELELEGTLQSNGAEHPVQVRNFSTSGASVFGSNPKLSNDMFVELHIAGQESLKGTVVSEVAGGYVLQFESTKQAEIADPALTAESDNRKHK